jgi:hypothetical protein
MFRGRSGGEVLCKVILLGLLWTRAEACPNKHYHKGEHVDGVGVWTHRMGQMRESTSAPFEPSDGEIGRRPSLDPADGGNERECFERTQKEQQ